MIIDGKNMYSTYGCRLLDGTLGSLLKYPKRKGVSYNDWGEADGIEPELKEVEFDPRSVTLEFLMESPDTDSFWQQYRKLLLDLSAPGYREMEIILDTPYRLRFDSGHKYSLPVPFNRGNNLSSFSIRFIEDSYERVLVPYPTGGQHPKGLYSINGYDFGLFGIGADEREEEILKQPQIKEPFSYGDRIDLSIINVRHREIRLNLWMTAESHDQFLTNYRAFFYQLTKPGTQNFYIHSLNRTTSVYYSDCNNYKIEQWSDREITARFSITLTVPVVSWVDAGGSIFTSILFDDEWGYLTDEDDNLLQLG